MSRTFLSKEEIATRTFFFDNIRAIFQGVLEGGFQAFAILIAIRVFHASPVSKSIIAAAGYAGLLVTPLTIYFASQFTKISATKFASMSFIIVSVVLFSAVIYQNFILYIIAIAISKFLYKQQVPLMIGVYGDNYHHTERGTRLSFSLMLVPISAMIFACVGGYILDISLSYYVIVILCMAIGAIGCAVALFQIPSNPVPQTLNNSIFSNFLIIWQDKFFRKLLLVWTVLGIDNQMTIPLRIEYLANSHIFVDMKNWVVVLTVTIIPSTFRILSSKFWGKAFDKFSLPVVATASHLFFVFGFWIFFTSTNLYVTIFSEALIGIGHGGGLIIWCLWITKIVPKQQYNSYMSANTVIVGIRNIIAPFIGYFLLSHGLSFATIGKCASLVILLSIIGLLSMRNNKRFTENYEK